MLVYLHVSFNLQGHDLMDVCGIISGERRTSSQVTSSIVVKIMRGTKQGKKALLCDRETKSNISKLTLIKRH